MAQMVGVVSTHSRLKAAGIAMQHLTLNNSVSTHSRLKAAGFYVHRLLHSKSSFNTQPPKGGWNRGRGLYLIIRIVSTHSRLKAAGPYLAWALSVDYWFQHTAA